jgi:hypothetical protein
MTGLGACRVCPEDPVAFAARNVITEIKQRIRCFISAQSENTGDHGADRQRAC